MPAELIQVVDMDTLQIQKDSFINAALEESYADLLFKADFQGEDGYIYFLFEHKSYPGKHIIIQLLKYMVSIWETKAMQKEMQGLPIVIPLVVYHGKKRWNAGNS